MATYSSISFDFVQAKAEASRLEAIADDLKRLAESNMQSSLNYLSTGWQGESATQYIRKGNNVKNDILAVANDLYAVANSIRAVAKKIYDAEMEAKRLAEEIARRK